MIFLLVLVIVAVAFYLFVNGPQFGRAPLGARKDRILRSPNYRNGQFQNQSHTPALAEGASFFGVLRRFLFEKSKRRKPGSPLPSKKTDLRSLSRDENIMVWFGHSSYFLQADGKRILVDPVFSGHASPVVFTTKSFAGTDQYSPDDLPEIDLLLLTHDHYDHMDHDTLVKMRTKIKQVVTGLGVGAHLERWGFDPAIIIEKDWNETAELGDGFRIHTVPARHFSGRGFRRNGTLWLSFILVTPTLKIFIGGDSGYDTHFREAGMAFGPFDLAILESGQYNEDWKYIHMMPEETVQAALDLQARTLFPVHWSKFSLSLHDWDEPIKRVVAEASRKGLHLLHPQIGEAVALNGERQEQSEWWKE